MDYIMESQNLMDFYSIGIMLELLLVTTCISTIIYLLLKNQYVSYLSSAPVFYFLSWFRYGSSHLMLLILAMFLQSIVIVAIQHQSKKKKGQKLQEKAMTN